MNDILAPKGTISEMIGTLKHLRAEIEKLRNFRAEVEDAHRREACAADLAREWEQHCKTAEAGVARLTAENEKLRAALKKINVGDGWAALIARAALTQETRDE